jgi:hypothetical protein
VAQFVILKNPIRNWHMDDIKNILYCCIIVHNMVTAERRSKLIDADVMLEVEAGGEAKAEDKEGNGNGISFSNTCGQQRHQPQLINLIA